MNQESIYRYTPKGGKQPKVQSFHEYVSLKFGETAAVRTQNYESQKRFLEQRFAQHQSQSSQIIKDSLEKWLKQPANGVHTSIIMHGEEGALNFDNKNWLVAHTYARECPNLKSVLRNVNNRFTERAVESDRRFLYDFQVLENDLKKRDPTTLYIIHLEDTDVFDAQVIDELIVYMHAYPNIPLRLVMSLSVSTMALEEQLHRETVEKLDTRLFEQTNSARYLETVLQGLSERGIFIGTALHSALSPQSPESILKVLSYFLMVYHSTNPLATLTLDNIKEHLHVIRRLSSTRENLSSVDIQDDEAMEQLVLRTLAKLSPEYKGFLSEFMIDDVDLYEDVFDPRYRHNLETALAEPKHYYPSDEPDQLRSRIPICALYSLIRVSDLFVNIYDHYQMFKDVVARPDDVSDEQWPRIAAAWYQQAVTELNGIGVTRPTKRKANSLEKVAFKGV